MRQPLRPLCKYFRNIPDYNGLVHHWKQFPSWINKGTINCQNDLVLHIYKIKKNPSPTHHQGEQTRVRRWVGTRGLAAGITFPCAASEPRAAQWPRVTLSERGYYRAFISARKRKEASFHRLLFLCCVISDVYLKQPLGNITAHEFFICNMTQIWSRTRTLEEEFYKAKMVVFYFYPFWNNCT